MKQKSSEENKDMKKEKKQVPEKQGAAKLIRIMSTDISGDKGIYAGLTKIKGVSWAMSNAVCNHFKFDKNKKVMEFTKEEIQKITEFLKNPSFPGFVLNARKNLETGEDKHLLASDLDLKKEFDIKRLKKIKSYRGLRHATGKPVRGQRTRSNFRKNKAIGVGRKKK
jgi:small subunit ribosomal protein S13